MGDGVEQGEETAESHPKPNVEAGELAEEHSYKMTRYWEGKSEENLV